MTTDARYALGWFCIALLVAAINAIDLLII